MVLVKEMRSTESMKKIKKHKNYLKKKTDFSILTTLFFKVVS